MNSYDQNDQTQFGSSQKIMIVAILSLLGVITLLISLHYYSKYLRRREEMRRRRAIINHLSRQIAPHMTDVNDSPREAGLTPLVIASIPTLTYNQTDQHGRGEQIDCSVCLLTIEDHEMVRILPNCNHMFHVECIDMWLGSHTTCPICRTGAEPKSQEENRDIENNFQPSAPPLEGISGDNNSINNGIGGAQLEKIQGSGGSGSRVGSFQSLVTRERLSRTSRSYGDEVIRMEDLERQ